MENIVRLAMEAGPVRIDSPGSLLAQGDDEVSWSRDFKEKEHVEGSVLDSLTRESTQDAPPLSAFRREVERRVMEQVQTFVALKP